MRQTALRILAVLVLLAGGMVAVAQESPVAQAEKAGLPSLGEFTLRPGDAPYVLTYTPKEDGWQRVIAAWGATATIVLRVVPEGEHQPITAEGNPASLRFPAKAGRQYGVSVGPGDDLRVAAVGLLWGGSEGGQAPVPPTTLEPPKVGVTQMPIVKMDDKPLVVEAPSEPMAFGPVTAGVSRASMIASLLATPETAQLLQAVAAGAGMDPAKLASMGLDGAPIPGGGQAVAKLPKLLESVIGQLPFHGKGAKSVLDLDWKTGITIRPTWPAPTYFRDGHDCAIAHWMSDSEGLTFLPMESLLSAAQRGVVSLQPCGTYPRQAYVRLILQLPPGPGTYMIVLHLTDSLGAACSSWLGPGPSAGGEKGIEAWCREPASGWGGEAVQGLALAPLSGQKGGFVGIFSRYSGAKDLTMTEFPDYWDMGTRSASLSLHIRETWWAYPNAGEPKPHPPLLFAGVTITKL